MSEKTELLSCNAGLLVSLLCSCPIPSLQIHLATHAFPIGIPIGDGSWRKLEEKLVRR